MIGTSNSISNDITGRAGGVSLPASTFFWITDVPDDMIDNASDNLIFRES